MAKTRYKKTRKSRTRKNRRYRKIRGGASLLTQPNNVEEREGEREFERNMANAKRREKEKIGRYERPQKSLENQKEARNSSVKYIIDNTYEILKPLFPSVSIDIDEVDFRKRLETAYDRGYKLIKNYTSLIEKIRREPDMDTQNRMSARLKELIYLFCEVKNAKP